MIRLNKFLAQNTSLSRRSADQAIEQGRVTVNGSQASLGQSVSENDEVLLDGKQVKASSGNKPVVLLLNKPISYVCSRNGQGSKTIYDLIPPKHHNLNPVGRLDKDSSGLLVMTNNGNLAFELTHPKFSKEKIYEVELDRELTPGDQAKIEKGVMLEDGKSSLRFGDSTQPYLVNMSEGRNRQIRRTFAALGYKVTKLHRIQFGDYKITHLSNGAFKVLERA